MPRARKKPTTPIEATKVRGVTPATIRRMRDAALDAVADARFGHELGRLALREMVTPGAGISAMQESVGMRYAELRSRWRHAIGLRPATAQAQDVSRVHGLGVDVDPDKVAALEAAMREADEALGAPASRIRRAVEIVCDRDSVVVGHQMLLDLRAGLDVLARLWGVVR